VLEKLDVSFAPFAPVFASLAVKEKFKRKGREGFAKNAKRKQVSATDSHLSI